MNLLLISKSAEKNTHIPLIVIFLPLQLMYSSRVILNETEPREDPRFFLGGRAPPGTDYSAPRLLTPLRNGVTDW